MVAAFCQTTSPTFAAWNIQATTKARQITFLALNSVTFTFVHKFFSSFHTLFFLAITHTTKHKQPNDSWLGHYYKDYHHCEKRQNVL